eukprot:gene7594-9095_t
MHGEGNFALTDFNDLLVQYSPLLGTSCDGNHTLLASKSKTIAVPRQLKQKPKPPNNFFPPLFRQNHQLKETQFHLRKWNHRNQQREQFDRSYANFNYRCTPPEHLIIDALHVPMARISDNVEYNPSRSARPTLWLTSSTKPLSLRTIHESFTKAQKEAIVQHLDPIIQNVHMRSIYSLMPTEITDAFKLFDAVDYPDVISLRDMEYPRWGEKCN